MIYFSYPIFYFKSLNIMALSNPWFSGVLPGVRTRWLILIWITWSQRAVPAPLQSLLCRVHCLALVTAWKLGMLTGSSNFVADVSNLTWRAVGQIFIPIFSLSNMLFFCQNMQISERHQRKRKSPWHRN